jgi:hypothetical protein
MTSQSTQSPGANDVASVAVADGAVSWTPDASGHTHNIAPTRFVEADGIRFAYSEVLGVGKRKRVTPQRSTSAQGVTALRAFWFCPLPLGFHAMRLAAPGLRWRNVRGWAARISYVSACWARSARLTVGRCPIA